MKNNERKKEAIKKEITINEQLSRKDIPFQVRPGPVTYNKAIYQKKIVAIICDSMPKSITLRAIKRKLGRKTIIYRKTYPGVN